MIDLTTLIRNFKAKIKNDFPDALTKTIYLTERESLIIEDIMGAVRSFEEMDFVKCPIVEFVNE